jgi:hypothetical protein
MHGARAMTEGPGPGPEKGQGWARLYVVAQRPGVVLAGTNWDGPRHCREPLAPCLRAGSLFKSPAFRNSFFTFFSSPSSYGFHVMGSEVVGLESYDHC